MNTPNIVMPGPSLSSQTSVPRTVSYAQSFYWSVRREFWENRLIYIAPLAAAAVFLVSFVVNMILLRRRMHGVWPVVLLSHVDPAIKHDALVLPFEMSAALIMGIALVVGIFYSLDALYGERRDRSILFWKSMPVSDLTTVLSKLAIPLVIIPVLSFAIVLVTQFIMLLLASIVLVGSGANIAALWTQESFFRFSLELFYHMLTVHGLWYAPLYAWLLLVSAAAPRAPFVWAVLPPFVIWGVEKMAFNTTYFLSLLKVRLTGPSDPDMPRNADLMSTLIPHHFFDQPALWAGLAVAAVFLAIAVRLRRYRGPV
ncbi:MAG TPA: ABC transporter permease [Candidatus Angelobacter sp.]|jgi:ABC-2 type transport system permease protein|nr:ABC transporter permease [Candidatus Angelobacter sp.]